MAIKYERRFLDQEDVLRVATDIYARDRSADPERDCRVQAQAAIEYARVFCEELDAHFETQTESHQHRLTSSSEWFEVCLAAENMRGATALQTDASSRYQGFARSVPGEVQNQADVERAFLRMAALLNYETRKR